MNRHPPAAAAPPDWQPITSGNSRLTLSAVDAGGTPALRMDFGFERGGGFVVARRSFSRAMPEEYAVTFRLRGRGSMIQFELKLTDATGRNVWRHVTRDMQPSPRWKRLTVASRDIEFAWGPAGTGPLSQLGGIEIALVSSDAGSGTVCIADLDIQNTLPPEAPSMLASSETDGFEASNALSQGWKPLPDDRRPWIVIDSRSRRTLGGLVIDWLGGAPARGFRVGGSNTGRRFKRLYRAESAGGPRSYVYLPGTNVRWLRLQFDGACAGAVVHLQSYEFSRSIDAFWNSVAKCEPRGWQPRWTHREQTLWTPCGTSHGSECALMNADGMVEAAEGSFSIEPMLWVDGRLFTWADVTPRQTLADGWQPVPSVLWTTPDWSFRILAEATVHGMVRVSYRLENLSDRVLDARVFALLRPFQVTPPWQSFRKVGGVSRIQDLIWRDGSAIVNGSTQIIPLTKVAGFAALRFDDGCLARTLESGELPPPGDVHDTFGFASGALAFDARLAAGGAALCVVASGPLGSSTVPAEPAFDWAALLPTSQWSGPGWMGDAVAAALTATAHVLVTRSGPALQPGPRRYTRSWIRDGAMMSAALLRMGRTSEVREFLAWYAPHQRPDGFVPCCIDSDGVDWLVEHDSHGQLIAAIADYYAFTGDTAFVAETWPFLDKAVRFIAGLLEPSGLLPISVSHEGYLAQPVHSYWDDFWALRGLRDAALLARAMGREEDATSWSAVAERVERGLYTSIEATRAQRQLDFIPGSVEWADFDPTATANAIYLFDVPGAMNRAALERTFDIYLADWRGKRAGTVDWSNYTPYEIRIIGALVRMGRREAALELLGFFLEDRRPPPWNQWPEIAWRNATAPAHVGDLPHTWIAAEYVLSLRSLFAYERESDASLVVAAGLAPEWLEGPGVRVERMPTRYGALSYSLRRLDVRTVRFDVGEGIAAPLVLRPPLRMPLRHVLINGVPSSGFDADSVTVLATPAEVLCTAF